MFEIIVYKLTPTEYKFPNTMISNIGIIDLYKENFISIRGLTITTNNPIYPTPLELRKYKCQVYDQDDLTRYNIVDITKEDKENIIKESTRVNQYIINDSKRLYFDKQEQERMIRLIGFSNFIKENKKSGIDHIKKIQTFLPIVDFNENN